MPGNSGAGGGGSDADDAALLNAVGAPLSERDAENNNTDSHVSGCVSVVGVFRLQQVLP